MFWILFIDPDSLSPLYPSPTIDLHVRIITWNWIRVAKKTSNTFFHKICKFFLFTHSFIIFIVIN